LRTGRSLSVLVSAARLGARFFVPAAFGRLGVAMTGLAVFWAVQGSSGSLGQGGAATGAFAVADAVVGPYIARLVDRWGQRRIVPVATAVFAVAVVALVVVCAGRAPGWVPIVLAAAAGATLPPVGALSAARWRHVTRTNVLLPESFHRPQPARTNVLLPESSRHPQPARTNVLLPAEARRPHPERTDVPLPAAARRHEDAGPNVLLPAEARRPQPARPDVPLPAAARRHEDAGPNVLLPAALSLEAAANDAAFLIGPVLVTTLGTAVAPWFALVPAVTLVVAGTFGLLTATASEPLPGGPSQGALMDRRLLHRGFLTLLAANLALGLFFGGIGVAITGFTLAHGAGVLTGPVTAVAGVVSLVAGLTYGALGVRRPATVMRAASIMLAAGCALLALTPDVGTMFAGYALVGGCVALVLVPGAVLLQEAIVAEVNTQALTWVNSASALGIAIAAPLTGTVVQQHGWPAGFLTLAALTATLPLIVATLPNPRGI
jgi:MFS family permease